MNLFFDLDGTLVDAKDRLYSLFIDISKLNITFAEYWEKKQNMISNEDILRANLFAPEEVDHFSNRWMENIESDDYLEKDKKFEFTDDVLKGFKKRGAHLFVITARQSKEQAVKQLKNLFLDEYFTEILVTEHKTDKTELIKNFKIDISSSDYLIGDTGLDIKTGKDLGIKTVAVLSGFRNKERLLAYKPDYIYQNILHFSKSFD